MVGLFGFVLAGSSDYGNMILEQCNTESICFLLSMKENMYCEVLRQLSLFFFFFCTLSLKKALKRTKK